MTAVLPLPAMEGLAAVRFGSRKGAKGAKKERE